MPAYPTTFIPRSLHQPGGFGYILRTNKGLPPLEIPREVAGWQNYLDGTSVPVTWAEINRKRVQRQREHLEHKLSSSPDRFAIRPAQLWTFHVPGFIYGGWWCYIRTRETYPGGGYACGDGPKGNITANSPLALELMSQFPMGLFPASENFPDWMQTFARVYRRPNPKRNRQGILNGWTDGRRFFLAKPLPAVPTALCADPSH